MIETNQFKKGIVIIYEGRLFIIEDFQHVKPGKGGAFVKTRLRDLKEETVIDRTFRSGERFEEVFLEERKLQFLYRAGLGFHFMCQETYEELEISKDLLGEDADFIKENMEVTASFHNGEIVSILLPLFVELRVSETGPGVRGDTVKSGTKPAKMETGLVLQVPLFINTGDLIKIDTRTREYVGRV